MPPRSRSKPIRPPARCPGELQAADYVRRRALFLPEVARYDWIMAQATTSAVGLPTLVINAMNAIERDFEPLKGVLPKDYGNLRAVCPRRAHADLQQRAGA